jgi:aminoglycoside phosphotransferase (APT) family kinase protein
VLGTGRGAIVYDIGGGRVLRRYRTPLDMTHEADTMRWVRAHGVPVPEVFDVDGADIVMERVVGRALLDGLKPRPHRWPDAGRVLADLHRQLDAVPVPQWMVRRYTSDGVADGVIHSDLHPDNVMMTADGPMLIDWTGACAGDRGADLAQTWIIVQHLGLPHARTMATLEGVARGMVVRGFLAGIDRRRAEAWLERIATSRLDDPNIKESERERLRRRVLSAR